MMSEGTNNGKGAMNTLTEICLCEKCGHYAPQSAFVDTCGFFGCSDCFEVMNERARDVAVSNHFKEVYEFQD